VNEHTNDAINVLKVLLLDVPTLRSVDQAAPAVRSDGCTPDAVRCNALEWTAMSAHHRGMMKLTLAVMFLALAVVPAAPQSPPPTGQKLTLSSAMIGGYTVLQRDLLDAAELMPEADYLFKPTPETRPFGQLVSHLALSQFDFCSLLQGGPSPKASRKGGDASLEGRADRAAQGVRDLLQSARQRHDRRGHGAVDEGPGPTRGRADWWSPGLITHGNEMYGTIAVYLRLKGIVPPTTARQQPAPTRGN
jgi:hypothetical protein